MNSWVMQGGGDVISVVFGRVGVEQFVARI